MFQIQLVDGWPFVDICGRWTNCTVDNDAIMDPDIAGIGVVIAFMLTAVVTIITAILAYWTDSLPANRYTELDDAVISTVRKILHLSKKLPPSHPPPDEAALLRRSSKIEAVERFMLALSDQQLVTAISLLIAAYGRICVISTYSFQVVTASAWFSYTTHLSTLTVLRRYFDEHKVLRTIRVVLMIFLFLLLCVTMILANAQDSNSGNLALCDIQLHSQNYSPIALILVIISILTFILWLSYGYGRVIMEIYYQDYRISTDNWLYWIIIKKMLPASAPRPSKINRVSVAIYQSFFGR